MEAHEQIGKHSSQTGFFLFELVLLRIHSRLHVLVQCGVKLWKLSLHCCKHEGRLDFGIPLDHLVHNSEHLLVVAILMVRKFDL